MTPKVPIVPTVPLPNQKDPPPPFHYSFCTKSTRQPGFVNQITLVPQSYTPKMALRRTQKWQQTSHIQWEQLEKADFAEVGSVNGRGGELRSGVARGRYFGLRFLISCCESRVWSD